MKRFNVSILAVVAVLAIGLTAFTKAEPAGKRATIPNCYTQIVLDCEAVNQELFINEISCTAAKAHETAQRAVKSLNAFASVDCGTVQTVFCCAQLAIDDVPCTGQAIIPSFRLANGTVVTNNFAKVLAVYCKPAL